MALDVENVVYGGVGGEELLGRACALEALHLALPPSGRLMRILGPIVLPSPAIMQVVDAEIEGCCAVGPQIISDQPLRSDGVFLSSEVCASVSTRRACCAWTGPAHRTFALGVDGAPQVNHAAVDFQIDLVKMPDRMRFGTALAQFRRYDRPEMIHPASDCFVRNCNSALREQIFDVTKAEREPEIEPDRLVNDLRREPIFGRADL